MMFLFVFVFFQSAKAQEIPDTTKQEEPIFEVVEEMPEFPGGVDSMHRFIRNNLQYPRTQVDFEGTVIISFVVEVDGSLSNVKVLRDIAIPIDEEVLRVVKLMPNWIPGKQGGKAVRARSYVPVKFYLE